MSRGLKILLGLVLLVAIVYGSVKVVEHYEAEQRSPYEKLEDSR